MSAHLRFGTLLAAGLLFAACQSTVYEDKLPPDDYFDPNPTQSCQPKTCDDQGVSCGRTPDGCGGSKMCGGCANPETCGGGGASGACGCTPKNSCRAGVDCGTIADGCGGTPDCGKCSGGLTCGAAGHDNVCGTGTCTAESDEAFCLRLGKTCGAVSTATDNCGTARSVASCGACTAPQSCGPSGMCGCVQESDQAFCTRLGKTCGNLSDLDNCGKPRAAYCGKCSSGYPTCGSGGCPKPDTGYQKWCPPDQTVCGLNCCAAGQACVNGACQAADPCNGTCSGATPVCDNSGATPTCKCNDTSCGTGACVDGACCATSCGSGASLTCCGDGQQCTAGSCTGTCKGITCNGVCCQAGQSCTANKCHTPDPCGDTCAGQTPVCDPSSHNCECNSTSCGAGEQCVSGACQAVAQPDAGAPDVGSPDVGTPDSGPPDCPESQRQCAHLFSYQGIASDTTAEVRGSFPPAGTTTGNTWAKGPAMTKDGANLFSATVPLPWNVQVQYKFFLNGSSWILDPGNPNKVSDGYGGFNSVINATTCPNDWTCVGTCTPACTGETPTCNATTLQCECTATSCTGSKVCDPGTKTCQSNACSPACSGETPSCNASTAQCECTATSCLGGKTCDAGTKTCKLSGTGPALVLAAPVTIGSDSYSFQVQFIPGANKLDTANTTVTLNGSPATLTYTPDATGDGGSYSVQATGVAAKKYGYLFRAKDLGGQAMTLFVPFWVEASSWTWKDAFVYQIMTDRFLNGDGVVGSIGPPVDWAGDWQGGDFKGISQKIDDGYFDKMGVSALWISSPIVTTSKPEPGKDANVGHQFSGYHAYWPIATGWTWQTPLSQFTTPIEPHFGTGDDLKTLVNKAHDHGMRVLVDFVPNHVHTDSPLWASHQTDSIWFNLPYHDCGTENLWDVDPPTIPNRTTCWFDPFLPDFNTSSQVVKDLVAAHGVWQVEEYNLDGFRVDATKHVMPDILISLRAQLDAAIATGLHFYMVGETLSGNESIVNECMGDNKLDGSVDDPLHYSMVSSFLSCTEGLNSFDNDVGQDAYRWTHLYSGALMGHFFGSHDVPRAISIANGDNVDAIWSGQPQDPTINAPRAFGRLRLAQAFLMTYDPVPIIWMGDEFGLPGAKDPDNRRMIKFDSALSANQTAALDFFRKLGTARKTHPSLRHGTRQTLAAENDFYAYARSEGGEVTIVVLNRQETSISRSVPLSGLPVTGTLTDALGGASATVSGGNLNVTVGALSAAIYTK